MKLTEDDLKKSIKFHYGVEIKEKIGCLMISFDGFEIEDINDNIYKFKFRSDFERDVMYAIFKNLDRPKWIRI